MRAHDSRHRLPLTQPGLARKREAQFIVAAGVSITAVVILFAYLV